MKIRLRLYASFEEKMPGAIDAEGAAAVDFPTGTRVGDVLDHFGIPYEEAFITLVDGRHARKDMLLAEGAELSVFPAIVGG